MNLKKTPQRMPGGFALERAAIGSARALGNNASIRSAG